MARDISHRSAFESHGETYVRVLAQQGGDVGAEAMAWLAEQQALRDEASSAKRDAREEETLSIARKAVEISERAERRAKWANIIAIAAIVFSTAIAIIGVKLGK